MIYKFAPSSGFSGNAENAYLELEDIREQNGGRLQPRNIVDVARNKNSSLHTHFEWDDTKAADEHRKNTARRLVRSIVINPETKQENATYRPYISVSVKEDEKSERYYQNIEVASVDEFESALGHFHTKLHQLKHAISQIEAYAKNEDQQKIATQLKAYSSKMENVVYSSL